MKATLERIQRDNLADVAVEERVPLRTLQGWAAAARQVGVDAAQETSLATASVGNEVIEDT